jgi:hypothetical protein
LIFFLYAAERAFYQRGAQADALLYFPKPAMMHGVCKGRYREISNLL